MQRSVDVESERTIALLKSLVEVNSGTMNIVGVTRVGEIARADLITTSKRADLALDFEGLARDNGRDIGSIARRSFFSWLLKGKGNGDHSSGIFSEKDATKRPGGFPPSRE